MFFSKIFSSESFHYLLIDAVPAGETLDKGKDLNGKNICLYSGINEKIFQKIGPYIFSLDNGLPFQEWFLHKGWGNSWGFILFSYQTIDRLRDHFLKFKFIFDENGNKQYFRYYDPRVVNKFLPKCTIEELIKFFGPVEYFIVEGNSAAEAIKYWHNDGNLYQEKISVSEIFGNLISSKADG
jgi:hypothetical protein